MISHQWRSVLLLWDTPRESRAPARQRKNETSRTFRAGVSLANRRGIRLMFVATDPNNVLAVREMCHSNSRSRFCNGIGSNHAVH
jgi:hypothetical protein